MGQIHYPERKKIKSPWLLTKVDFEELVKVTSKIDALLEDAWLERSRKKITDSESKGIPKGIEALIKERKNESWYYEHTSHYELISKDSRRLTDKSLSGLLKDQSLETIKPKSFSIKIGHGKLFENTFELRLNQYDEGELEYTIKCDEIKIKDEIHYEIDNWIKKRKPQLAAKIWSNYGIPIMICSFLLGLVFLSKTQIPLHETYQESLRTAMYNIAESGINDTNKDKALELLLKLESGFRPSNYEPILKPINPIWKKLTVLAFLISIAAFFRPKTTIGLGKMQQKINLLNLWIKVVLITIPSVLILGPIFDLIKGWLY